jgi:hypothetical protein
MSQSKVQAKGGKARPLLGNLDLAPPCPLPHKTEIVTYHWEVSYDWGRSIHIKGDANSKRLCIIISSSDRGFDLNIEEVRHALD